MLFFVFGIHILLNFRVNSSETFPIIYNLIELLLRPSINILFIITGYGLISKYFEKDYKYFLNKFFYFAIESIIFLILLKGIQYILNHYDILVINYFSPWFLFTYVLVPFILMILKFFNVDINKIKFMFLAFLPISILLTFANNSHTGFMPYPLTVLEYLPFVFMGYFLIPKLLKMNNLKFLILSFIYIIISFYLYMILSPGLNKNEYIYNYFYQYFSPHVITLTFFEFILLYNMFKKMKKIKINLPTLELYIVSGYSIGIIDYFIFNNSLLNKNYEPVFKVWIISFIFGILVAYTLSKIYKYLYYKYLYNHIKLYIEI